MQLRRAVMAAGIGGLPSAYQRVEYIQNSGSQYIDSGYIPTVSPKIVTTIRIINSNIGDLFGFLSTTYPNFIICYAGGTWFNRWGSESSITFAYSAEINDVECIFGQETYMDNVLKATYNNADWSSNVQSLRLFGGRTINAGMRIYDCQIYDGNSMVRNFIPCYRKSDNVIGMYDTVTKTFYTNAGTGEFIVPA